MRPTVLSAACFLLRHQAADAETCCEAVCGDGQRVGFEQCDDGNELNGDGCSAVCEVETGYACTPHGGAPDACALCGWELGVASDVPLGVDRFEVALAAPVREGAQLSAVVTAADDDTAAALSTLNGTIALIAAAGATSVRVNVSRGLLLGERLKLHSRHTNPLQRAGAFPNTGCISRDMQQGAVGFCSRQDDSCAYSHDGVCDHGTRCTDGADCLDCGTCYDNSCQFADDGVCDVPTRCAAGTDDNDCGGGSPFLPLAGSPYTATAGDWSALGACQRVDTDLCDTTSDACGYWHFATDNHGQQTVSVDPHPDRVVVFELLPNVRHKVYQIAFVASYYDLQLLRFECEAWRGGGRRGES